MNSKRNDKKNEVNRFMVQKSNRYKMKKHAYTTTSSCLLSLYINASCY